MDNSAASLVYRVRCGGSSSNNTPSSSVVSLGESKEWVEPMSEKEQEDLILQELAKARKKMQRNEKLADWMRENRTPFLRLKV